MHSLENPALSLRVSDDSREIVITDRVRGTSWQLKPRTRTCRTEGADADHPLPSGEVSRGDAKIVVRHSFGDKHLKYTWTLGKDFVEISLSGDAPISQAALPGAFHPIDETDWEIAVPTYQGCLIRRSGETWSSEASHGGHTNFSMSMSALLTQRASLLIAHESPANWRARYGEDEQGLFSYFQHHRCPVDGWKKATVRLYPCAPGLTAACRRYRRVVQTRGDWRLWSEKIAQKPILENLFGALMAFVGYNHTNEIDYITSTRRLKAYGFEKIFFYPMRMCHYALDFLMGGDRPTWHSDETLAALHEMGGIFLAPWAWVFEGLDDGSDEMDAIFRIRDGNRVGGWQMDDNHWYQICPPYQIEHLKQRLATDMKNMDWLHFDVSACVPSAPCTSTNHDMHNNKPMGSLNDAVFTRNLMSVETVGNRVASSEGFSDYFCRDYDIGSTKIMPIQQDRTAKMPVPMTMLVLHDCCIHDWWELQNYNVLADWPIHTTPNSTGIHGSGMPRLKAAQDALYGCPPNLFPFGKQYAWVDKPGGATKPFTVRLNDPPVQAAMAEALPVARLHGRIGMCDLQSLEFLSDDRYVQATTFSDGTRIIANLAPREAEVEGIGVLQEHRWRETKE